MSKVDLTQYNKVHSARLGNAVTAVSDLIDKWEKYHSYNEDDTITAVIYKPCPVKEVVKMFAEMIEAVAFSSGYIAYTEAIHKVRNEDEYAIHFRFYKQDNDNVDAE